MGETNKINNIKGSSVGQTDMANSRNVENSVACVEKKTN